MSHSIVTRAVAQVAIGMFGLLASCGGGTSPSGSGEPPAPPPAPVAVVAVAPGDTAILMENQAPLRVVLRDAQGNALSGRTVSWSSSAPATAPVSPAGVATGLALGSATITATAEGQSGSATIEVIPQVVIAPELPSLFPGDTTQLTVRLLTASGRPAGAAGITWTTANSALATVTPDGVVTGMATGTVRLFAAAAGATAGVDVAVTRRPGTLNRKIAWIYTDGVNPTAGYVIPELWMANQDGSGAVRVSALGDYVNEYAWSPDGSRLAVQYWAIIAGTGTVFSRTALVVINADGSGEVALGLGGSHPRWSPDGERIAYRDGAGDLRVVNRDGTGLTNLTPGDAVDNLDPEWSPDGRLLVYRRQPTFCDEMWLIHPDGTGRRRVTIPTGMCFAWYSPDGKYIAYSSYRPPPDETGAWLVTPWGGTARPISANCDVSGSCSGPGYAPVQWLSDGYRVLVRGGSLFAYDVRTSTQSSFTLPVPANQVYAFSPDQLFVLYGFTETDGRTRIATMTSAGANQTPVSAFGRAAVDASWQPAP